jgi:hypothetical protein
LYGFGREVDRLAREIISGSRAFYPGRILAVLDNPLMMAVAHRVASTLDIPLTTLIWDAPEYLLSKFGFDRFSRRLLLREFNTSLSASQRVAVVSEAMQRDYAARTSAPVQILRHGVPMEFEVQGVPGTEFDQEEWKIGFGGSMYSECAWRAFLGALDHAGWTVAGKPVRLKLVTPRITLASRRPARVDFLGCLPSPEAAQSELAKCHLNYLPQPFAGHLWELAKYSFPTKLTSYLATGRPVIVHSPVGASLSLFYETNPIGAHACSLRPGPIIEALEALLGDRSVYEAASRQVRVTAQAHFAESVFHAAIDSALPEPGCLRGRVPMTARRYAP